MLAALHVHVHEAGQAIVGNIGTDGAGHSLIQRINLMLLEMRHTRRCGPRTRSERFSLTVFECHSACNFLPPERGIGVKKLPPYRLACCAACFRTKQTPSG
jgi:hypothetical protein